MAASELDSVRQALQGQERLVHSLSEQMAQLSHRTDSLLAAVPDTVRDTLWAGFTDQRQGFWHVTGKDVLGWIVTIVGIGIAATVAIIGWNVAASNASRLQERRRQDEEDRRRAQVVLRSREGVATAARTARSTLRKDVTHPMNPETMNGLIIAWQRYDRVSDDIGLIGDPGIEEDIETVLDFARMIAEKIRADEQSFRATRDKLGVARPNGLYVAASVLQAQLEKRGELRTLIVRLRDISEPLQTRIDLRFPRHGMTVQEEDPEERADTEHVIALQPGEQPPPATDAPAGG